MWVKKTNKQNKSVNKLNFELKIVPVTKIAELKEQTRYVHHARASKKKRNIKQHAFTANKNHKKWNQKLTAPYVRQDGNS